MAYYGIEYCSIGKTELMRISLFIEETEHLIYSRHKNLNVQPVYDFNFDL